MFDDDREDRMTRRERVLRRAKDRWRDHSSDHADEEDFSIDRMYRSADQLASLPTPRLDIDEWEYERNAREHRRELRERQEHRSYPPEPKPPLIPEAALRVLVGDLAPQAAGALNYLQNNKTAQSAAAMAGMGLVALVLPQVLK
jgi:hypothetical protein